MWPPLIKFIASFWDLVFPEQTVAILVIVVGPELSFGGIPYRFLSTAAYFSFVIG